MAKTQVKAKKKLARRLLTPAEWAAARQAGTDAAKAVLARRQQRLKAAGPKKPSPGILVAEGDSWFDYPMSDVLAELEDQHRWEVVSSAHKGDRVEEMAYDYAQLSNLERELRKLSQAGKTPRAFLLSGGGNDIAGEEFSMLLNHKRSGLPALNARVVSGLFEERLAAAIVSLASAVTALSETFFGAKLPILIHGYDRPVPDGRGFLGGFWFLPGPWLEPGFRRKGFSDLEETTGLMSELIDRFNEQLARIAGGLGLKHLHYIDLRGTLSNEVAGKKYRKSWANELHPTGPGFKAVADRVNTALSKLPQGAP